MADYILTYSRIKFYPFEPVQEDINIVDIAHALSLMTRANGHCCHFYSVAQHSINCFKEAKSRRYSRRVQLGCLLHDASESYISDLTRPVKRNLPAYFDIEEKLQSVIYDHFGLGDLADEELEQIRNVDDALLYFESEALMDALILDNPPYKAMEHEFSPKDFTSVENEFLSIFNRLTSKPQDIATDNQNDFKSVGIDGCRGGWVAVSITKTHFEIDVYQSIEQICSKYYDSDCLLIDMPIGLPESSQDIRPDSVARMKLPGKASSIFNTPCRQSVYANTYSEANEINRRILGKGLSRQSYAISGKIKEIDEFLRHNPQYKNRVLESHPELCLTMLNSGKPLLDNKKSYEGAKRRIELLNHYYNKTEELMSCVSKNQKFKNFSDDIIDALCLAITGMLSFETGFKSILAQPMMDKQGILMQMVYTASDFGSDSHLANEAR